MIDNPSVARLRVRSAAVSASKRWSSNFGFRRDTSPPSFGNRAFSSFVLLSSQPRGNFKMGNLSVVVMQLKKERERVQKAAQRIDAALAALGKRYIQWLGTPAHDVCCSSPED